MDFQSKKSVAAWSRFEFEGVSLQFPFSYKEIEKTGFILNPEKNDFYNNLDIKQGEYSGFINLINCKNYDAAVEMSFTNKEKNTKKIKECESLQFTCSVSSFKEQKCPSLTIADKISWGAAKEEIIEKLGEPTKIKDAESESKYTVIYYEKGSQSIMLKTTKSKGLCQFEIANGEQW